MRFLCWHMCPCDLELWGFLQKQTGTGQTGPPTVSWSRPSLFSRKPKCPGFFKNKKCTPICAGSQHKTHCIPGQSPDVASLAPAAREKSQCGPAAVRASLHAGAPCWAVVWTVSGSRWGQAKVGPPQTPPWSHRRAFLQHT